MICVTKKVLITATVMSHIAQFYGVFSDCFRSKGFEIDSAANNDLPERPGKDVSYIENMFWLPFSRSPFSFKNYSACRELKKIIQNGNYDLVQCNTPICGVLTRLAARKERQKGLKVVYVAHGFHFYTGAPLLNWLLYYPIEKIASRWTDLILTINDEDFQRASKSFHCRVKKIHGVGVDGGIFHKVSQGEKALIRKKFGFSEDDAVISCVGEFNGNKNQSMAIDALAVLLEKIPSCRLVFVGEGQSFLQVQDYAKSKGVFESCRFVGYSNKVHEYLQASDLAISCSKREGLGLNLVEAMMVGLPVVATTNRGHDEVVAHEKTGFLVSINDFKSMASLCCCLLTDREKYKSFSDAALERGYQFSADAVRDEINEIVSKELGIA